MRFFFLLFVIFLTSDVFAQPAFYIKPIINVKYQTSNRGVLNDVGHVKAFENPFFNYTDRNFVASNGFDLGLAFGVQLNTRHFFELEYVNEAVGKGAVLSYYSVGALTDSELSNHLLYRSHTNPVYIGFSTHKIGLKYNYNIFSSKNKFLQMRLNSGCGLMFNKKNKSGFYNSLSIHMTSEEGNLIDNEGLLYSSRYSAGFSKGVNGYVLIGLGFDINSKRRNILSFDINYTQGFASFYQMSGRFDVGYQGGFRIYDYVNGSRGSGLNIQVSHRLQLHPWIKSKRKELQEQGVYKSKDK